MQIAGPEGEFCLHESTTLECPAVLMIAEDIGIASVQGLLGQLVNVDYAGPVRVFWHARAGMNRYAANACRALADALDDGVFTFIEAPIDPSTAINAFGSGRDIAVYLAASADAIKVDIAGVRALGVCAQRIFSSANDEGISV